MKRPCGIDIGPVEVGERAHHEHLTQLGVDTYAGLPANIAPNGTTVGDVPPIIWRVNPAVVGEGIRSDTGR